MTQAQKDLPRPVNLEVTKLDNGTKLIKPENQLGTHGFSPKAWTAAVVRKNPIPSFLAANKAWSKKDINAVV